MAIEVAKISVPVVGAARASAAQINEQDTLGNPAAALPPGERASVPIGVSINAAPQTAEALRADRARRHHRHPARHDRAHRAAHTGSPTSNRTTWRSSSSTTKTFPGATRRPSPTASALRPWISLLVLEEGEFERDDRRLPLPVVTVKRHESALPPSDETWLFAHVHTEQDIGAGELSRPRAIPASRSRRPSRPIRTRSTAACCRRAISSQPRLSRVSGARASRSAGWPAWGSPRRGVPAQKPAWDAQRRPASSCRVYFDW